MSNMDVLVAATKHGAEVCDLADQLGTLEPGKLADVIVVNGDPLARISDIGKVELVFKEGVMHRSEVLGAAAGRIPL
jgi:imidazolonepropionase-like amidohydrolase